MGQSTISRDEDILGNITLKKQYNFALYANRFTVEDVIRIETIAFLMISPNGLRNSLSGAMLRASVTIQRPKRYPLKTVCCISCMRTERQADIKFK